eukprot:2652505-Pleurochrysis_carterae.AAC.1
MAKIREAVGTEEAGEAGGQRAQSAEEAVGEEEGEKTTAGKGREEAPSCEGKRTERRGREGGRGRET